MDQSNARRSNMRSCISSGKFLECEDGEGSVSFDHWVAARAPASGDLLLQMDIEGAEVARVLLNVSDHTLSRFRILAIEFHNFYQLMSISSFPIVEAVLQRLMNKFIILYIYIRNNTSVPLRIGSLPIPPLLEVTFLRKDRAAALGLCSPVPASAGSPRAWPPLPRRRAAAVLARAPIAGPRQRRSRAT